MIWEPKDIVPEAIPSVKDGGTENSHPMIRSLFAPGRIVTDVPAPLEDLAQYIVGKLPVKHTHSFAFSF